MRLGVILKNIMKKSEDITDILITLLIDCRQYYGVIGFDFPSYEISVGKELLSLDCGCSFSSLNTDERVVSYVKNWYSKLSK